MTSGSPAVQAADSWPSSGIGFPIINVVIIVIIVIFVIIFIILVAVEVDSTREGKAKAANVVSHRGAQNHLLLMMMTMAMMMMRMRRKAMT